MSFSNLLSDAAPAPSYLGIFAVIAMAVVAVIAVIAAVILIVKVLKKKPKDNTVNKEKVDDKDNNKWD